MPPITNGLFTSQPVLSVPAPSSSSVPADPFRNVSMAPHIKLEPGAGAFVCLIGFDHVRNFVYALYPLNLN